MIGIFRQKSSGNALLLLLYGLVLKFPLFLSPVKPLPDPGNNYIYQLIIQSTAPLGSYAPVVFSVLAFLLLFTQATLLNRIVNSLKLFQKANYLTGMSYLLVTSLMAEWTAFSAPLLVNSLMIWIWYRMIGLYNNAQPKTSIYNVAVLVGLLPLVYSPSIAFFLLLLLALIITRPLRLTEWMVALLGILTPYYFLFVILYLTDQWHFRKVIPSLTFRLPALPASMWITGGIVLLIIPFLSGSFYVQAHLNKMLIQVRKAWGLLVCLLIVSLLIVLLNPGKNYLHWMLFVIPVATFHAAAYYYIPQRWLALTLHYLTLCFALLLNYGVFT